MGNVVFTHSWPGWTHLIHGRESNGGLGGLKPTCISRLVFCGIDSFRIGLVFEDQMHADSEKRKLLEQAFDSRQLLKNVDNFATQIVLLVLK